MTVSLRLYSRQKILELAGLITLKAQNENLILHAVDAELQRDLVEKDFPLITEKISASFNIPQAQQAGLKA